MSMGAWMAADSWANKNVLNGSTCDDYFGEPSSWEEAGKITADIQTELSACADKFKHLVEVLSCCLKDSSLSSLVRLHNSLTEIDKERPFFVSASLNERVASLRAWALKETENSFRRDFKNAAAEFGWKVRCTGSEPLELKVGSFYLRPNFAEGTCCVAYARMLAANDWPLEANYLFESLNELIELLNRNGYKDDLADGVKPDSLEGNELFCREFFADVWTAYNTMLRCRRKSLGDRVPLHDIWAVLSVLRQSRKFRENGAPSLFKEYSRLQFCWDIVRLRRCAGLQCGKLRLNLSTATIGTTKNKEKVFWLDDGVGNGQYYLSLWFQNKE
ncbi:MAG: hypothetical protein ACI376_01245 [Candidatus Bruticola sp.]